jgi:hypothetical protein
MCTSANSEDVSEFAWNYQNTIFIILPLCLLETRLWFLDSPFNIYILQLSHHIVLSDVFELPKVNGPIIWEYIL